MALFYTAYFDASRPGFQSAFPVLTIGGAASPVKKWARFSHEWGDVLKAEAISSFHATDFASSKGEFKAWKGDIPRRSAFLRSLCKVIKRNVNKLFLVGVEMEAWNAVNTVYMLEETFNSPFAIAALGSVLLVKKWAKVKNVRTPLEYVFEDGDEGWDGVRKLCARPTIGIIPIRLPKEKAAAFQVGDLVAWKYRIAATNSLRHLDAFQGNIPDLEKILSELQSLDQILAAPGRAYIHSEESLIRTCAKSNIQKRSSIHVSSSLPPKS